MKNITLEGHYRYRSGEKVAKIKLGRGGFLLPDYPVIAIGHDGCETSHNPTGRFSLSAKGPHPLDLIEDKPEPQKRTDHVNTRALRSRISNLEDLAAEASELIIQMRNKISLVQKTLRSLKRNHP